jgi:hypothetical protein
MERTSRYGLRRISYGEFGKAHGILHLLQNTVRTVRLKSPPKESFDVISTLKQQRECLCDVVIQGKSYKFRSALRHLVETSPVDKMIEGSTTLLRYFLHGVLSATSLQLRNDKHTPKFRSEHT